MKPAGLVITDEKEGQLDENSTIAVGGTKNITVTLSMKDVNPPANVSAMIKNVKNIDNVTVIGPGGKRKTINMVKLLTRFFISIQFHIRQLQSFVFAHLTNPVFSCFQNIENAQSVFV